jgi:uncharacterized protein YycO
MKKVFAFVMALVFCCALATAAGAYAKPGSSTGSGSRLQLILPDLQKADPDIPA